MNCGQLFRYLFCLFYFIYFFLGGGGGASNVSLLENVCIVVCICGEGPVFCLESYFVNGLLLFYLTIFTRGELWAVISLFVLFILFYYFFFLGCCVVWAKFFLFFFGVGGVCFWQNNNIAQIIVFGRFGSPEKGL